jgi:pyruvate formate lyase activating enzyme
VSASELWREVAPQSSFISGVTVSGGEPTLQLDFVSDFFTIVKGKSRLNTLIETNGHVTVERLKQLLPVLDMAMVDLKAMDPDSHRRLTGQSNELVKEAIQFLAQQNRLYAVRKVIAPGCTDLVEDAVATARFIADIDPAIRLRFLRFRPHGTSGVARTWKSPSDETMDRLVETARAEGVRDVDRSL